MFCGNKSAMLCHCSSSQSRLLCWRRQTWRCANGVLFFDPSFLEYTHARTQSPSSVMILEYVAVLTNPLRPCIAPPQARACVLLPLACLVGHAAPTRSYGSESRACTTGRRCQRFPLAATNKKKVGTPTTRRRSVLLPLRRWALGLLGFRRVYQNTRTSRPSPCVLVRPELLWSAKRAKSECTRKARVVRGRLSR